METHSVRDRLALVYLLTFLFGLIACVVLNNPFKMNLEALILRWHPKLNNCPRYLFLMLTVVFFIFISIYDYSIRS